MAVSTVATLERDAVQVVITRHELPQEELTLNRSVSGRADQNDSMEIDQPQRCPTANDKTSTGWRSLKPSALASRIIGPGTRWSVTGFDYVG